MGVVHTTLGKLMGDSNGGIEVDIEVMIGDIYDRYLHREHLEHITRAALKAIASIDERVMNRVKQVDN